MKRLLLLPVILIAVSSCAPKILIQEAYLLESEDNTELSDNRVDVVTYYIGDALDYISFQVDIDNRSNDTIALDQSKIFLLADSGYDKRRKLYPIAKQNFIRSLSREADEVNREKKVSTAANILLSGLSVVGAVVSGADATSTVIYSTGSAVDILENRRGYEEAEMTLEDMIEYHEDYTLGYALIPPGQSGTYDIHFDRLMINGYCDLDVFCAEQHYNFEYNFEVVETKVR